jgi:hypothetical protein
VTFVEHQRTSPEPIGVQAAAARVAWHQMTELTLMAVCQSVERAVSLPARPEWERNAAAHAELFDQLAAAADRLFARPGLGGRGTRAGNPSPGARFHGTACARLCRPAEPAGSGHDRDLMQMTRLIRRSRQRLVSLPPSRPGTGKKARRGRQCRSAVPERHCRPAKRQRHREGDVEIHRYGSRSLPLSYAGYEFLVTTSLLFSDVTAVRWLRNPASGPYISALRSAQRRTHVSVMQNSSPHHGRTRTCASLAWSPYPHNRQTRREFSHVACQARGGPRNRHSPRPAIGMSFMIMGQKWRIAPPTAHDHEKPNGSRIKLSPGGANVPAIEWESSCHRAGVVPGVGGNRHRPQATDRKRHGGAITAGFCMRHMNPAVTIAL